MPIDKLYYMTYNIIRNNVYVNKIEFYKHLVKREMKGDCMESLIEVRDMYKIYNPGENEVRALDGVSLKVQEGEFVAIIGHSGSGKSTLMNMLGCLDVPTKGTYILNGRDVSGLTDNELSDVRNNYIGFIFQGFNLIPNLTALENVELPLIYRKVDRTTRRKLAIDALEKVGLKERMKHKPAEMSGGQQQRVAIARAIAMSPPLILADEPTGNLDSKSTKDIMGILNELNEQGNTIVLITHDDAIAANAKRVVRIMDGMIESDITRDNIDNNVDNDIGMNNNMENNVDNNMEYDNKVEILQEDER